MRADRAPNARLAALDLMAGVLDDARTLAGLDELTARLDDPRDPAFARHLAYGVLRWLSALEWLAAQLLTRPLRRRDRDIERLILMGLFELWKDPSAPHATIHECAEGGRRLGKSWSVGLINAVLRRFQREQDQWLEALGRRPERFAHPPWLLDRFRVDWPGDWERIAEANNRPGPLWLRLNPAYDPDETRERLERAGFATQTHPSAPEALKVSPPAPVEALPGFSEGRMSVQDPAAQLAARLLAAKAGHRVLDACAAPGGKSAHVLELTPGVRLTALDVHEGRVERMAATLRRLDLKHAPRVRLLTTDATQVADWWDERPFQRILLDAPCTATGVIRRHPEIKWLRTPKQVRQSLGLQQRLLLALWPLLEPGGILLYATCSVLREENERQMEAFLERQTDAEIGPIDAVWGRASGPGRQILPGELEMDGFFYARLHKRA